MNEREPGSCENVRIGPLVVAPPLALAPLAGYTIPPFRALCLRLGAELTYTEMVSASGLVHANRRTTPLLVAAPGEERLGVQLFGADAAILERAVHRVVEAGAALIDLNMGCPVPKVTGTGAGSALLRDPSRALRILERMVAAASVPVTVKVRLGWEEETLGDLLPRLVETGVAAVTVHGRTRAQGYRGEADWAAITRCRDLVAGRLPLFGSGDLFTADRVVQVLEEGRCDGVQLARGALGNPWLFREVRARLRGESPPPVTGREVHAACLEILNWLVERKGERGGIQAFRSFFSKLLKGRSGARECRRRIYTAEDLGTVEGLLDEALL